MNVAEKFNLELSSLCTSLGITLLDANEMEQKEHKLVVTIIQDGSFRKAKLNEEDLTKQELYDILGIKSLRGYRLEKHLDDFAKVNKNWEVEYWETDIT